MSKKKSLGHNPLGTSDIDHNKLRFIGSGSGQHDDITPENLHDSNKSRVEKKAVCYYLEVQLVRRLKKIAHSEGRYYSHMVSEAVENLLNEYEYKRLVG